MNQIHAEKTAQPILLLCICLQRSKMKKKKKIATEIAWGRVRIRKNKRHKWNNTQINHIILTTTNHVTQ